MENNEMQPLRCTGNNPPSNVLPLQSFRAKVEDAVARSGYPLQTLVTLKLQPTFKVTEEWGYIDRTVEGARRTLDLFAYCDLGEDRTAKLPPRRQGEQPGFVPRPRIALLIECKRQRELPYIFFKSFADRGVNQEYPSVFAHRNLVAPLKLDQQAFFSADVPRCNAFAKAQWQGKDGMALSGDETHNGIVLPLISAFEHARRLYGADVHPLLTLMVCVIDGPMILADASEPNADLAMVPWVRVVRHETDPPRPGFQAHGDSWRDYGIEIVHIDFLEEFIEKHVVPLGTYFTSVIQP